MSQPAGPMLRIATHMLPELIVAYESALESTRTVVQSIRRRGRVPEPWTHDPHTENITWTFNQWAVDGPDSAYQALRKYQSELADVLSTLKQMQIDYQRTEAGIADDMSRM